jgi:hypothetical protein
MNKQKKSAVFLALLVLIVIAATSWWLRGRLSGMGAIAETSPRADDNHASVAVSPAPSAVRPEPPRAQGTNRDKFIGLSALSAASIEFYGKVVDQDSVPLQDVKVLAGTGSKSGFMQDETRSYETTTNAEGLFSFNGFKGDALIIDLKKTGYNFESDRRTFLYSAIDPQKRRFIADRHSPVVFQMWKSLGPEPLVHYEEYLGRAPSDGTPVRVDLVRGKLMKEGGDLLISVKWAPHSSPDSYLFDWSVALSAPAGGIREGGGDVMFVAPAEGYAESLRYDFPAAERQTELHRILYVVSRNRQIYSRVEISLQNQPGDSVTTVNARVWLNPKAGSRNLEPVTSPRN